MIKIIVAMKTSALKSLFYAVIFLTAFSANAQIKSTIKIKSITIENGDTIVNEKTYQNDGNAIIYDTMSNDNSRFLFFNNEFEIDTNFSQGFSDTFSREMSEFIKKFNSPMDNFFDIDFDFFDQKNSLNFDSLFMNHAQKHSIPLDTSVENIETPLPKKESAYNISCENIFLPEKHSVTNYTIHPDSEEGSLKVSFSLDPEKSSTICFIDANNRTFYKEKVPKSKGTYTRIFDLIVMNQGTFYISISQGNLQSKSLVNFRKNE